MPSICALCHGVIVVSVLSRIPAEFLLPLGARTWLILVDTLSARNGSHRAAIRTRAGLAGARVFPQQNNLRSTAQVLNV